MIRGGGGDGVWDEYHRAAGLCGIAVPGHNRAVKRPESGHGSSIVGTLVQGTKATVQVHAGRPNYSIQPR